MIPTLKAFNISSRGKSVDDILKTIEAKILIEANQENFRAIFSNCGSFREAIIYRLRARGYSVKIFGKTSIEISWTMDPLENYK